MTGRHVQVHLCVNDPRNGEPTGHVLRLDVMGSDGDCALGLEASEPGPVCRIDDGLRPRLKIGYHWYPIRGHHIWAGNWCWDSVAMEPSAAVELLNHARASGWWQLMEGYTSWWERWDAGEPFSVAFITSDLVVVGVGS